MANTSRRSGKHVRTARAIAVTIAVFIVPIDASATSYAIPGPVEVTERTDVWIFGNVESVTASLSDRQFGMDRAYDVSIRIRALAATDDTPRSALLSVSGRTIFRHSLRENSTVLVALKRAGTEYTPMGSIGMGDWFEINRSTGKLTNSDGGHDAGIFWRYLQGLRYAIDSMGEASDEDRAFWAQHLASNNLRTKRLADSFFDVLEVRHDNPTDQFALFLEEYDNVLDHEATSGLRDEDARAQLTALATNAVNEAKRRDDESIAQWIVKFIDYDAAKMQLCQQDDVATTMLRGLLGTTDDDVLDRIPGLHTEILGPGHKKFIVPKAPSRTIDDWLWKIARAPEDHGLVDENELSNVWNALAIRNHPEIRAYMEAVVAGDEIPGANLPKVDRAQLPWAARSTLTRLDHFVSPRKERLESWVLRIGKGEWMLLGKLSYYVSSDDVFLLPAMKEIENSRWRDPGFSDSPYYNAATILKKLPDQSFAPMLKEWATKTNEVMVLEALVACGERDRAAKLASQRLSGPVPYAHYQGHRTPDYQRLDLIQFLGKFQDPELIEPIVDALRTALENPRLPMHRILLGDEWPAYKSVYSELNFMDSSLLAVARSGHKDRTEILRDAYKSENVRSRIIAAIALFGLEDNIGEEVITAYRERTEVDTLGLDDWVWNEFSIDTFHEAIAYLEQEKLDLLFLERSQNGFDEWDARWLHDKPDFFQRNRTELLRILRANVDTRDDYTGRAIVECLQAHTHQDFQYLRASNIVRKQPAIQAWKAYIDTELERISE